MEKYIKLTDALAAFDPDSKETYGTIEARGVLIRLPAADVVPVVRCKDCKRAEKAGADRYLCCATCELVSPQHYCGYGARMDREETT